MCMIYSTHMEIYGFILRSMKMYRIVWMFLFLYNSRVERKVIYVDCVFCAPSSTPNDFKNILYVYIVFNKVKCS